jgi:hypothetical protein
VQVQEAENQIITHYEVFDDRPSDRELLLGAVEAHQRKLGRLPQLVTADAGFYSHAHEQAVQQIGVKWVRCRTAVRAARSERNCRSAAGSRKRKAGVLDVRAALAYSSAAMDSAAAATVVWTE